MTSRILTVGGLVALAQAKAIITNNCPGPVYVWSVPNVGSAHTDNLIVNHGGRYEEPWRYGTAEHPGIALKISPQPDGIYKGADEINFAYSVERSSKSKIWIDLSPVRGKPFDNNLAFHTCHGVYHSTDVQTSLCDATDDVELVLCGTARSSPAKDSTTTQLITDCFDYHHDNSKYDQPEYEKPGHYSTPVSVITKPAYSSAKSTAKYANPKASPNDQYHQPPKYSSSNAYQPPKHTSTEPYHTPQKYISSEAYPEPPKYTSSTAYQPPKQTSTTPYQAPPKYASGQPYSQPPKSSVAYHQPLKNTSSAAYFKPLKHTPTEPYHQPPVYASSSSDQAYHEPPQYTSSKLYLTPSKSTFEEPYHAPPTHTSHELYAPPQKHTTAYHEPPKYTSNAYPPPKYTSKKSYPSPPKHTSVKSYSTPHTIDAYPAPPETKSYTPPPHHTSVDEYPAPPRTWYNSPSDRPSPPADYTEDEETEDDDYEEPHPTPYGGDRVLRRDNMACDTSGNKRPSCDAPAPKAHDYCKPKVVYPKPSTTGLMSSRLVRIEIQLETATHREAARHQVVTASSAQASIGVKARAAKPKHCILPWCEPAVPGVDCDKLGLTMELADRNQVDWTDDENTCHTFLSNLRGTHAASAAKPSLCILPWCKPAQPGVDCAKQIEAFETRDKGLVNWTDDEKTCQTWLMPRNATHSSRSMAKPKKCILPWCEPAQPGVDCEQQARNFDQRDKGLVHWTDGEYVCHPFHLAGYGPRPGGASLTLNSPSIVRRNALGRPQVCIAPFCLNLSNKACEKLEDVMEEIDKKNGLNIDYTTDDDACGKFLAPRNTTSIRRKSSLSARRGNSLKQTRKSVPADNSTIVA